MKIDEVYRGIEQLKTMLNQMIRVAVVTSTNPSAGRVRVQLKDSDQMVSRELLVVQPKTAKDKYYWMPDVSEQVLCLFLPYGLEQGFVIGAVYSSEDTPPVQDQDKSHIAFKDGTFVEYDRSTGVLTVDCVNEVVIRSAAHVQVRAARVDLN